MTSVSLGCSDICRPERSPCDIAGSKGRKTSISRTYNYEVCTTWSPVPDDLDLLSGSIKCSDDADCVGTCRNCRSTVNC
jgi:hypothetical protein